MRSRRPLPARPWCRSTPAWCIGARRWSANASTRCAGARKHPAGERCRPMSEAARLPGYRLSEDAPLAARNTFGVAARAPMLVEVTDTTALPGLMAQSMLRDNALLVLGGGSNLLFAGDAPGAVLALETRGIRLLDDDGSDTVIVRAEAGGQWHDLVL